MSKKALKLVGQRPMLAFIIMATLTLGLLFSGWLAPTPGKAQQGMAADPTPNQETTNCEIYSTTSQCLSNASMSLIASTNTPVVPLGSVVSLAATTNVIPGAIQVTITYTNTGNSGADACPNTTSNYCYNPIIVSNAWWEAQV